MAENNSQTGTELNPRPPVQYQFKVLQVLVLIFLGINFLMIMTFFRKECFNSSSRYILFALSLLSDSLLLILSDILLILASLRVTVQVWLCVVMVALSLVYIIVTPLTLTAMTLERYVAVCMPLNHAQLTSMRNTKRCVLIIHLISSVPCIICLLITVPFISVGFFFKYGTCSVIVVTIYKWQGHVRTAVYQIFFVNMCFIIVVCYVRIVKVAKVTSGENNKSLWRALRTVILHGFQLLLCLIQLWKPFMDSSIPRDESYNSARFILYILCSVTPRCLSPLIYGLRDEAFSHELKKVVFFWKYKRHF